MANQRWATVKNDYCLTFNKNTNIVEAAEDKKIKAQSFNFKSIA